MCGVCNATYKMRLHANRVEACPAIEAFCCAAGYGSFFQRIKSSIIFSLFLNETLVIADDVTSEHHYNIGSDLNEVFQTTDWQPDKNSSCRLQRRDGDDERQLLHHMCLHLTGNSSAERSHDALAAFRSEASCRDVIHDKNYRREDSDFVEAGICSPTMPCIFKDNGRYCCDG